jgi:hypothetical protein
MTSGGRRGAARAGGRRGWRGRCWRCSASATPPSPLSIANGNLQRDPGLNLALILAFTAFMVVGAAAIVAVAVLSAVQPTLRLQNEPYTLPNPVGVDQTVEPTTVSLWLRPAPTGADRVRSWSGPS